MPTNIKKVNNKSSLIFSIMLVTATSKLTGFLRDMLLASRFGVSMETDSYLVAMTIPFLLFNVIGLAWGTVYIPILTEHEENPKQKQYLINNTLNTALVFFSIIACIGIITSPILIKMIAPNFTEVQYNFTVKLTRILFPLIVFMSLSALISSVLQTYGRFLITAGVGIPYNLIIIITLIFFSEQFGILGLTIATLMAGLSQLVVQLPSLYKENFNYRWIVNIKDPSFRKLIKLSIPTIIGLGGWELNTLIDRSFASRLEKGSISALNYANTLNWVALGIFGLTISTIIYPELSKLSAKNDLKTMREIISESISLIIFILLPATVGMIVLRYPILQVLFERGAFDREATSLTASALFYYSIGLCGFGVRDILNRCFYALQDMKTPMINNIFMICVNIITNILLIKYLYIKGIALATSMSILLGTIMLMWKLYKKINYYDIKNIIYTFIKVLVSSMGMGIALHIFYNFMSNFISFSFFGRDIIILIASIVFGILIYVLLAYLIKLEHMINIIFSNQRQENKG